MTNKKELKETYKEQFGELRRIINVLDPEGLIEAECPEDEYDYEISRMLAGLFKCENERQVSILVVGIFNKAFGRNLGSDEYSEISKLIWKWWIKRAPPKEDD